MFIKIKKLEKSKKKSSTIFKDIDHVFKSLTKKEKMLDHLKILRGHSSILARMLEVIVYVENDNKFKALSLMESIVKKDFVEYLLLSDLEGVHPKKTWMYLKRALLKLKSHFNFHPLYENLILYLSFNSSDDLKNKILNLTDLSLDMELIRKKYQSLNYGHKFPFVFFPLIYEKGSSVELKKYFDDSQLLKSIKKHPQNIIFIRGLKNLPKEGREDILWAFEKLHESKETYESIVAISVRSEDSFSEFLQAHSKTNYGILVKEKRRFFLEELNKGHYPRFSLIGLFSIGDFSLDNMAKYLINYER